MVAKTRVGRSVFEYECKVVVDNRWEAAVKNLQLELVKVLENVTIIEPDVLFSNVEIGTRESLTSTDTCTFRVDRSQLIDPTEIAWRVACDVVDSPQTVKQTVVSQLTLSEDDADGIDAFGPEDLSALASQWLWTGPKGGIEADVTADGSVDFADFAFVLEG